MEHTLLYPSGEVLLPGRNVDPIQDLHAQGIDAPACPHVATDYGPMVQCPIWVEISLADPVL